MNWQNIFVGSGSADWILLTAFHSLWLSLAAILILRMRSLRGAAVRSTWCTFTLIVLFALPLTTWLVPRIEIGAQPRPSVTSVQKTAGANTNSNEEYNRRSYTVPLLNRMLDMKSPLSAAYTSRGQALMNLLGIIWLGGGLFFLGRILYELAFLKGYRNGLEQVEDARISAILQEISARYGFRRATGFYISPKLTSPISMGIYAPSVIFPKSLYQDVDSGELRAILLHELAHIYHYDHMLGLFQRLLKAMYWWNPFVHFICNALSAAREDISDNHAMSGMGSASTYATLLVNLAEKTCLVSSLPCTAGMANPYISLEARIKYLISKERDMSIKTKKSAVSIMAASIVLLCSLVVIGSQVEVFGVGQASDAGRATITDGWFKAGSMPQLYEIGEDQNVRYSGPSSLYLFSTSEKIDGFGTIMKQMQPGEYLGKRIRMSAYIKAENIIQWAGMWMRVDGQGQNNVLGFDNMQSRPISGTVDWKRYEIVLDVPQNAIRIAFGVLTGGPGKVWLDNIQFDIVNPQEIQTTGQRMTQVGGWGLAGNAPQFYEIGEDQNVHYSGPSSFYLFSTSEKINGFGTIMKEMQPGVYLGKRVRMSAYIKAENVARWAGMWMRVDGQGSNDMLAFDNMQSRPISGTADWKRYEIVLEVPQNAIRIAFGVLTDGPGKVWVDEVKFDVVDDQTPTTGYLP